MNGLIGLVGSFLIAGIAYRKQALSASGMVAAVCIGTLLYALGTLPWFGTLIAFFVSSTILSKWKSSHKLEAESSYEKTGRRDVGQVLANGGVGVVLCVAHALWPHPLWWAAFIGAMATVNADTWATEIGGLSKTLPRSILTGHRVPKGTSGGITPLGLTASIAGGCFIGVTAWLLNRYSPASTVMMPGMEWLAGGWGWLGLGFTALLGGTLGALADSMLGAKLQTMYRCPICGKDVERHEHCGQAALHIRGLRWMNNDAVNMLSSIVGAGIAVIIYVTFFWA